MHFFWLRYNAERASILSALVWMIVMEDSQSIAHDLCTTVLLCPLAPLSCSSVVELGLRASFVLCFTFQDLLTVVFLGIAQAHATGRGCIAFKLKGGELSSGSLPLHNLVSDSANPHYVSDPLPQPLWDHCSTEP